MPEKSNPFNISFGEEPMHYISRLEYSDEIINTFKSEYPSTRLFLITGLRGTGKTVMLSHISGILEKEKDWYVIPLNPSRDLLQSLKDKLNHVSGSRDYLRDSKLNVSIQGIGVSVGGSDKKMDIEDEISTMLQNLHKRKKRVLVTIDEVTNSNNMQIFASAFQIFIRQKLPLFLLMTGLYHKVNELQNNELLTFLYRAPRISLEPLKMFDIKNSYQEIFNIPEKKAITLAKLTNGYPYAYQLIGYLYWKNRNLTENQLIEEYDLYLERYVYEKVWSELTKKEKDVLIGMSTQTDNPDIILTKDILEASGMAKNEFSVYRERLIKKGIIESKGYGTLSFILPRFSVYVRKQAYIQLYGL